MLKFSLHTLRRESIPKIIHRLIRMLYLPNLNVECAKNVTRYT